MLSKEILNLGGGGLFSLLPCSLKSARGMLLLLLAPIYANVRSNLNNIMCYIYFNNLFQGTNLCMQRSSVTQSSRARD